MKNSYIFFDITPIYEDNEFNCVCRAISLATSIDYKIVRNLINLVAERYKCEPLCVCCYHNLLEKVFGYEPKYCLAKEKVRDVVNSHKDSILLIRIKSHLTCCIYGACVDIWDCTNEYVDCFWVVE